MTSDPHPANPGQPPKMRVQYALEAAEMGFLVFPCQWPAKVGCNCGRPRCSEVGKHPLISGWQGEATTDEAKLRSWWGRWPMANVGILTGARAGYFVLDVDPRHGGDETLAQLEETHGKLPETPKAISGSGGRHIFFRYPTDGPVPNSVGRIGEGLDIRGGDTTRSGLVIGAGSLHENGREYAWDLGSHPAETEMVDAPSWLLELARHAQRQVTPREAVAEASPDGPRWESYLRWVKAIPAIEGQRNNSLFRIGASGLGRGFPVDAVGPVVFEWGQNAGLEDDEIQKTWNSAQAKHAAQPFTSDELKPAGRLIFPAAPLTAPPALEPGGAPPSPPPPPPPVDPGDREEDPPLTEVGNAELLFRHYGKDFRYTEARGWLIWDGSRWIPNLTEVETAIKDVARSFEGKAIRCPDDKLQKRLFKHFEHSESARGIKAVTYIASTDKKIKVHITDFDKDPWLLTCYNGTVDLRTGEIQGHDRSNLCTRQARVNFNANATAPNWKQFLWRIMDGNQATIDYLQRAIGYSLTGSIRESCFFIAYGIGSNGKTVLLEVISEMMGDYSMMAGSYTFAVKRGGGNDSGPSSDLARLAGARMININETPEGCRLDEQRIKQFTGGDTVTARFLFKDEFQFQPAGKLWLRTNHRPNIKETDHGIWRRVKLIPFRVTIPDAEQDKTLLDKLKREELPGILNWAIEGCLKWQADDSLGDAAEVVAATADYRVEMDVLAAFIDERILAHAYDRESAGDIYAAYVDWCEKNGERPMSQNWLGRRLGDRGFTKKKDAENGRFYYQNVQLRR